MNEEVYPECPIRNILARFCDKWSLLIMYTLNAKPTLRFNELRKEIPDISQKMLTNTLRTLQERECDETHRHALSGNIHAPGVSRRSLAKISGLELYPI